MSFNMDVYKNYVPYVPRPNAYFEFDWKANRNFCLTAKHFCDFECEEAETEVAGDGKFFKFALKTEGEFADDGTFKLIGYYKTEKNAVKAMVNFPAYTRLFLWNREGKCVDGVY